MEKCMKSGLEKNKDAASAAAPVLLFRTQHTLLFILTTAVTFFAIVRFFR